MVEGEDARGDASVIHTLIMLAFWAVALPFAALVCFRVQPCPGTSGNRDLSQLLLCCAEFMHMTGGDKGVASKRKDDAVRYFKLPYQ